MKKYTVSKHYLDKCINEIQFHCYSNGNIFAGNELQVFCANQKNLCAIRLLEAMHEIRTSTPDGSAIPCAIWLEDAGVLHTYAKREKRIAAIKGFILGIISTVISTTLFPCLFNFLMQCLQS